MKSATVHELKNSLKNLEKDMLVDICLRLAKFKKDNKELLSYVLFHSEDEGLFIREIKAEIDAGFEEINRSSLYYVKKTLRRIIRILDKNIRYSGNKETEVELRIYISQKMVEENIPIDQYKLLTNMFDRQLVKIKKALSSLHEDLQFDYEEEIDQLQDIRDKISNTNL